MTKRKGPAKFPNKLTDQDAPLDLSKFVQGSGMSNGGMTFPHVDWNGFSPGHIYTSTGTSWKPLSYIPESTSNIPDIPYDSRNPNPISFQDKLEIQRLKIMFLGFSDKPNLDIDYCLKYTRGIKFPRRMGIVCREGNCNQMGLRIDHISDFLTHAVQYHGKNLNSTVKLVSKALDQLERM